MKVTQKNYEECAHAAVLALRKRGIPEGEVLHEALKFYDVASVAHRAQAAPEQTIHILKGGIAICGTMRGLPGHWPEGHKWISFKDHDVRTAATCEPCKEAL